MNIRALNILGSGSRLATLLVLMFAASGMLQAQLAFPGYVTPSSGSGYAQLFSATYTDPWGGSDMKAGVLWIMNNVLPGTPGSSSNQCILRFDLVPNDNIVANSIRLIPDAGGAWSEPVAAGESKLLANSQCTLLAAGSSAQVYGNTVTVNFQVTFSRGFIGAKQLYMEAEDARGAWSTNFTQQFGNFNVTPIPLRSWKPFYPMDRGQRRGERAGNPWMDSPGQNGSLGAQLTWDLPGSLVSGDPPSGANRPHPAFPSMVAAWPPYYPAHQPEYYLNWWCRTGSTPLVFDPAQHNCTDIGTYQELITEIPGVDGTPAAYLGVWGQGSQSIYAVNYDAAVCDLLDSGDQVSIDAVLSDPARSRPLIFALPADGPFVLPNGIKQPIATFVGPPVCRVAFMNPSVRSQANIYDNGKSYSKSYIATTVFDDFLANRGHVVEAVNYYYDGPDHDTIHPRVCVPIPGNSPVPPTDSSQVMNACVTALEAYFMIDTTPRTTTTTTLVACPPLWNGMVSWGGIDANGNFGSAWDWDRGWGGRGDAPPPDPQFTFDLCSYSLTGGTAFLSCQTDPSPPKPPGCQ